MTMRSVYRLLLSEARTMSESSNCDVIFIVASTFSSSSPRPLNISSVNV